MLDGVLDMELQQGLSVRRVRHMDRHWIEILGTDRSTLSLVKAKGAFSAIVDYRMRCFVPTDASGPDILGSLIRTFGLKSVHQRPQA